MSDALVHLSLLVLVPATVLNLFLLIRIIKILQIADLGLHVAGQTPLGKTLPAIRGETIATGEAVTHDTETGLACVVVFIAAACPKCKSKLPELERIDRAIETNGHALALWIVGVGTRRQLIHILKSNRLAHRTLIMPRTERKRLNPGDASPYYVFLNGEMVVEACNYLGDENWTAFVDQIGAGPDAGDVAA